MLRDGERLFGTDGVRGLANVDLTPDFATALGRAAAERLPFGPVLIGRDTRRSGELLSAALQVGFQSVGIDTWDAGVLPSGGIAHLTGATGAMMGAVVSASHNPARDNGIKLLASDGSKLTDAAEDRIEERLRDSTPFRAAFGDRIGTKFAFGMAANQYLDFLVSRASYSFRGIELMLDCANGAAFKVAPWLFERLKADVSFMATDPDGTNINANVGATKPEALAKRCKGKIGLAFDGDADRLIAVDETGRVANGDVVIAVIARHMQERRVLRGDLIVGTVMANLGFRKAMQRLGITVVETQVGDRYVVEEMRKRRASLGGEQSGHVVFLDDMVTGDGLLTALRLVEAVAASGKTLAELRDEIIVEYPQVLINVPVADRTQLEKSVPVLNAVHRAEKQLASSGRVLVRASGTEHLVRVMVEASSEEEAQDVAETIAKFVVEDLS